MQYPEGEQVSFRYHPQGAVDGVHGDSDDLDYVHGTVYDAAGRMVERRLGQTAVEGGGEPGSPAEVEPVLVTAFKYYPWTEVNGQGRLRQLLAGTSANPAALQNLRYTYDVVGNVKQIQDWNAGAGGEADDPSSPQTQAFDYDDLNRLIAADVTVGEGVYNEHYRYDPETGNMAVKGGINYGYAGPQPHAVTHLDGVQRYWYDANGNQTRRMVGNDTYELTYDAENRLTGVQKNGSVVATFLYDGNGNRVKGAVDGVTTLYVGNHYEVQGDKVRKYYHAAGRRIGVMDGEAFHWLLSDHLGSTAVIADANGNLAGEMRYRAFGETRYEQGATPTSFRYTGQRQETALGLYYYRARWYDPALGRFTQADTIVPEPGNPQAYDKYAYAYNNPLLFTDPSGHFTKGAIWDYIFNRVLRQLYVRRRHLAAMESR